MARIKIRYYVAKAVRRMMADGHLVWVWRSPARGAKAMDKWSNRNGE